MAKRLDEILPRPLFCGVGEKYLTDQEIVPLEALRELCVSFARIEVVYIGGRDGGTTGSA